MRLEYFLEIWGAYEMLLPERQHSIGPKSTPHTSYGL